MNPIIVSLVYIILSCSVLVFAKWLYVKTLKYSMYEEIQAGNVTAVIPYCGFFLGNVAILVGAFLGDSPMLMRYELIYYLIYALLGVSLMLFSGFIVEKTILHKFNNVDEIVRDRNIGTAAVYFGMYVASGLIISACVTGETLATYGRWYGLASSVTYYILGMVFLILFSKLYDKLTPYSLLDEIEKDNAAVGIAFGGNIIAIGLILMRATIGDIGTWQHGLMLYFVDLTVIVLLLPSVAFILDRMIVKSIKLKKEIKNNNVAAGLAEAFVMIGFATLIFFMVDLVSIL